jgi:thymidine phosphorylase
MNQPLGNAVGNSLEVMECVEIMRGEIKPGAEPVLDLSLELSAQMLVLARVDNSLDDARERLKKAIASGSVLETFRQNVAAQGGDPKVCDDPANVLPLVGNSVRVESPRSGHISSINTTEIGHAIAAIGGGRVRIEDAIDPTVGFLTEVKLGTSVKQGDTIGVIYCRDQVKAQEAAARIVAAYEIGDEPRPTGLVKEVINQ